MSLVCFCMKIKGEKMKTIYALYEEGFNRHEHNFSNYLYLTTNKDKAIAKFNETKQSISNSKHFYLCYGKKDYHISAQNTKYESPVLYISDRHSKNYYYLYIKTLEYEE